MYIFLVTLAIIVSVLLILLIMMQNPKGGGLNASFGNSTQMLGVQKTGDVVEKGTWVLMGMLFFIALSINFFIPSSKKGMASQIEKKIENAQPAAGMPTESAFNRLPSESIQADTSTSK